MNRVIFTFDRQPVVNEILEFTYYNNYPDTSTTTLKTFTFKTTRVNPFEITIGATLANTITNFINEASIDIGVENAIGSAGVDVIIKPRNGSPLFNPVAAMCSISDDYELLDYTTRNSYIYINPKPFGGVCNSYMIQSSAFGAHYSYSDCNTGGWNTAYIAPLILVPTPCVSEIYTYNGTIMATLPCPTTPFNYDTIRYYVKSYTGDIYNIPVDVDYQITKQKVLTSQSNIYINLSNITKSGLRSDINNYYSNTNYANIGITESKWVHVLSQMYLTGTLISNKQDNFLITDGYSETVDKILLTMNYNNAYYREVGKNSKARFHFRIDGLTSVIYENELGSTNITSSIIGDVHKSNEIIKSILVDTSKQYNKYTFTYGMDVFVVNYNMVQSGCIDDNYEVVFKNRYGFLETVSFNKKADVSTSLTMEKYRNNLVDLNGNFDTTAPFNKEYNKNGMRTLRLNTDYMNSYMTPIIEEIYLATEVYVNQKPANVVGEEFIYINGKYNLTQYQVSFMISEEIIKTSR